MKIILIAFLFSTSTLTFAGSVADFVRPIAGEYQMNGKGCGLVSIVIEEINGYTVVKVQGTLFHVSTAENFKLKGRELSFSTEETDNAWPNLKDWKKLEAKIVKDQAGRLKSLSVKSGWGKPFYRSRRWETECTIN